MILPIDPNAHQHCLDVDPLFNEDKVLNEVETYSMLQKHISQKSIKIWTLQMLTLQFNALNDPISLNFPISVKIITLEAEKQ